MYVTVVLPYVGYHVRGIAPGAVPSEIFENGPYIFGGKVVVAQCGVEILSIDFLIAYLVYDPIGTAYVAF
jgi:hypothetical protein